MIDKTKGRNGGDRATPRNAYNSHHISKNILVEHFCFCRPGVSCILCLTWNQTTMGVESRHQEPRASL